MTDWLMQANLKMYDLHAAVAASRADNWRTPKYRKALSVGDRAWLQIVGPHEPGLYYIASITSVPYETPESGYSRWHTDIRYDFRLDPPLLRAQLTSDPVLKEFAPLRGFQGTLTPVPAQFVARLDELAQSRLVSLGKDPGPDDLDIGRAIERHNLKVRQHLKAAIKELSPEAFEYLVVSLLEALGYDVRHTGRGGDGGVDAVAVLSLGGLTSVVTRIQAKRWTHSVSGATVRELRGALKIDERGLVVTTAEFTPAARSEAEADGKARIGLVGGEELARLCAAHGIGVQERRVDLLELDPLGLTTADE